MIRVKDAVRMAVTKLHGRKVRLAVTVTIAGILFSLLTASSLISRGAFASIASFYKDSYGERFLVSANQYTAGESLTSPDIIERAIAINAALQARKAVEAKRIGVAYDPKSEKLPVGEVDTPQGKQRTLDLFHPAAQQAIAEYNAAHRPPGIEQLQAAAAPYHPRAVHQGKVLPSGTDSANLAFLKDGKESLELSGSNSTGQSPSGADEFVHYWGMMSGDMLKPYILAGASTQIGTDGSIPVVAPYNAVEQIAGLQVLPAKASPAERLARLEQLRTAVKDMRFQICYRNKTSIELLNEAVLQQQELSRNKSNQAYVKPALIRGLPSQPCGLPPVTSDSRSADEKKDADKKEQFDRIFGKSEPRQQILTFRVIGITPDGSNSGTTGATSLIGDILSTKLSTDVASWFTPLELEEKQDTLKKIFTPDSAAPYGTFNTYYVEFAQAANAKAFLEEQNCQPNDGSAGKGSSGASRRTCESGKSFMLSAFGSNGLALDDVKEGFVKIFMLAAFGFAAVAAIIMMGTVGRTIVDSRRETAVFRAMGANKADIVIVYLIYTFLVSLIIVTFAMVVGIVAAQVVHHIYSDQLTVRALVAFNAPDLSKHFDLFRFYISDMLAIFGLAAIGGLLSAIFPLARNLSRSPIHDMRDDS